MNWKFERKLENWKLDNRFYILLKYANFQFTNTDLNNVSIKVSIKGLLDFFLLLRGHLWV